MLVEVVLDAEVLVEDELEVGERRDAQTPPRVLGGRGSLGRSLAEEAGQSVRLSEAVVAVAAAVVAGA